MDKFVFIIVLVVILIVINLFNFGENFESQNSHSNSNTDQNTDQNTGVYNYFYGKPMNPYEYPMSKFFNNDTVKPLEQKPQPKPKQKSNY